MLLTPAAWVPRLWRDFTESRWQHATTAPASGMRQTSVRQTPAEVGELMHRSDSSQRPSYKRGALALVASVGFRRSNRGCNSRIGSGASARPREVNGQQELGCGPPIPTGRAHPSQLLDRARDRVRLVKFAMAQDDAILWSVLIRLSPKRPGVDLMLMDARKPIAVA
jgi:hypothetical protein